MEPRSNIDWHQPYEKRSPKWPAAGHLGSRPALWAWPSLGPGDSLQEHGPTCARVCHGAYLGVDLAGGVSGQLCFSPGCFSPCCHVVSSLLPTRVCVGTLSKYVHVLRRVCRSICVHTLAGVWAEVYGCISVCAYGYSFLVILNTVADDSCLHVVPSVFRPQQRSEVIWALPCEDRQLDFVPVGCGPFQLSLSSCWFLLSLHILS